VRSIAEQEIKRLNINIEVDLHNAFKAATAARGENMTDVLLQYIQDYVTRHGYDSRKKKKERR
jgi:uncharacterized protein (DUF1778 family)